MTVLRVHDHAPETDLDFHEVSQLSSIGVLADDVVGDLIRVRAGLMSGPDSDAIRSAVAVFRTASEAGPVSGELWDANRVSDTLRFLNEAQSERPTAKASEDIRDWMAQVANDLEAVTKNQADGATIGRLEQEFSMLSHGTLAASNDAIRQRGYATTWLTA